MENKRFKLRILPLFEDDLNEVVDYISLRLRNPSAAEDLVDLVQASIQARLSCAESFEPYPSTKERETPYYRIYVKSFVIFYVVIGDVMEVRRILYNKRSLRSKL